MGGKERRRVRPKSGDGAGITKRRAPAVSWRRSRGVLAACLAIPCAVGLAPAAAFGHTKVYAIGCQVDVPDDWTRSRDVIAGQDGTISARLTQWPAWTDAIVRWMSPGTVRISDGSDKALLEHRNTGTGRDHESHVYAVTKTIPACAVDVTITSKDAEHMAIGEQIARSVRRGN